MELSLDDGAIFHGAGIPGSPGAKGFGEADEEGVELMDGVHLYLVSEGNCLNLTVDIGLVYD